MQFQVFLCFGNSVASTRFLLQDEFNIQTTQCDNCIIVSFLNQSQSPFLFPNSLAEFLEVIVSRCYFLSIFYSYLQGFMFCLSQIACIFSIVAMIVGSDELSEASQILSCFSDMVYCSYATFSLSPLVYECFFFFFCG